jgi:hypothetical protein
MKQLIATLILAACLVPVRAMADNDWVYGQGVKATGAVAAQPTDRQDFDRSYYGNNSFDKYRAITYWGIASLNIMDFEYGSRDAQSLKLTIQAGQFSETVRQELKDAFRAEFKKLFGDLPLRDVEEGQLERLSKMSRESSNANEMFDVEKFEAVEEARRNALYGGRAGAIFCSVQIKRRSFPVLLYSKCSMSASDSLRGWGNEKIALGFSTPELVDREIQRTLSELLKQHRDDFERMRKYDPKK